VEGYVDLSTGCEVFQKKTVKTYSPQGQLINEEVFDASGGLLNSLQFSSDVKGKNISVGEDEGDIVQTEYDEYGNPRCMTVTKPDGTEILTRRAYDFANRLIREETVDPKGKTSVLTHTYNAIGNRIKTDDANGNTTYFTYDSLGRLVHTQYPPVLSAGNQMLVPTTSVSYDIFDHTISTTDANGWTTETEYNVRGKPIQIRHPDNTVEKYTYSADGLFIVEANLNGLVTRFETDGMGRALKIEQMDRDGTTVGIETAVYNSFHRLSQTDSRGTSHFKYDGAGRQVAVEQQAGGQMRRLETAYDSSGLPLYKKNWFGEGERDYLLQTLECDQKHQPQSLNKQGADGCLLQQTGWEKTASVSQHVEKKPTYNALGQQADSIETVDEQGNITWTTLDALGRVESVVKKNPFGTLLSKVESRYDAVGNKLQEIHTRRGDPFILAWSYGPKNRIESLVEGLGSPKQKTTSYYYNSFGELAEVVKNDGVSIMRHYDALGRVLEIFSSDHSIHYWYTYDDKGNIVKAENLATGQQTLRAYDGFNQLVSETLDTGLSFRYAYDGLGRKTQMVLPDESAISYRYDAVYLREVVRLSAANEELYKHTYTDYGLEGSLRSAQMIHSLGQITFSKAENGHLKSIQSPYWSMETPEKGYDDQGNLHSLVIRDAIGKKELSFDYDERQQLVEENDRFYSYDALQNRSTSTYGSDAFNEMNQLLKGEECHYCYDANGNLIEKIQGGSYQYFSYDALDRLTQFVEPKKQKVSYAYEPLGRRLSKTVEVWDSLKRIWKFQDSEKYLYDGECEIGSLDKDNRLETFRVLGLGYGAEAGAAISMELNGKVYAPIHDHRGSVVALIDSSTFQAAESLRYSAFGETERYDETGEPIENSMIGNPWEFFGKRYDSETGLLFFGKRYYDSIQGRWTTPDPLHYVDGPNRYAFVGNNPISKRDLFGEYSVSEAVNDAASVFRSIGQAASKLLSAVQRHGSSFCHQIQQNKHALYGKLNIHLARIFSDPPELGVMGNGEISDSVRLTMINGILTLRCEFMSAAASVSAMHGGVNVHYVFRPTQGLLIDLAKSLCAKLGFVSVQAQQLALSWKGLINEMGGVEGDGTIIHYAHSIGGTDTYAARHLLSAEEQKMIKVYTFGSASMIPDQGFQSVLNYVSRRDAVSLTVDVLGFLRAVIGLDRNVIYIGNFFSFPLIDHLFDAESYRGTCQLLGYEFQYYYGTLA
jgi:RHS repeat-associated protein